MRRVSKSILLACALAGFGAIAVAEEPAPVRPVPALALAEAPVPPILSSSPEDAAPAERSRVSAADKRISEKVMDLARALFFITAGGGNRPYPGMPQE